MSIFIGDWLMSSEEWSTRAIRTPDGWAVSWIPGRLFDRNQAVTALVLAEAISNGARPDDRLWPHVQNWLAELGLAETALNALPAPTKAGTGS